jgi:hydrogenase maturation factor
LSILQGGRRGSPPKKSLARRFLDEAFDSVDANWRGIGTIPCSGYALKAYHAAHEPGCIFPMPTTRRTPPHR